MASNPTSATPSLPSASTTTPSSATSIPPSVLSSIPPLNTQPIELDSTPIDSPTAGRAPVQEMASVDLIGGDAATSSSSSRRRQKDGVSPGEEEDVYGELSGEVGMGKLEREKRAAALSKRSKDPAVLVDIPPGPQAEELEVVAAAAGVQ
ncbi:hypothetical protein K402DRAFT_390718 [Aulographum hederae CBS 113979]|uniref:Uncharacterized protein n=1 Tax=Aulographum hederae CBS 113979 TaxID=1176131 RepID=A0A6G1H9X1_9PEZI|nr:hypothetical protein K402DRAFT_390718 [Aulographum hederae CBS 113979]